MAKFVFGSPANLDDLRPGSVRFPEGIAGFNRRGTTMTRGIREVEARDGPGLFRPSATTRGGVATFIGIFPAMFPGRSFPAFPTS